MSVLKINIRQFEKDNKTYIKISLNCPFKSYCNENYMKCFCEHEIYSGKKSLMLCEKRNCMNARKDDFK